jgi:hypothetical protein
MPTVYTRTAASCPTPIGPVPAVDVGNGSSGPFSTGMVQGVSQALNQVAAILALFGIVGGGAYAVMAGLGLSAGTGLNVVVANGTAMLDAGPLDLVTSDPVAPYQVVNPGPYTLADNSTNFVWLTNTGSLVSSTSTTFPTGARVFLGTVTTVSGAITQTDGSNVVTLQNGTLTRITADIGAPTDAPPAGMNLWTVTSSGVYLWASPGSGLAFHAIQSQPPVSTTISATRTLTPLSSPSQILTASGGNQIVLLPDPSLLPLGWSIAIYNSGGSNNIVIKDHTGTTTYAACTPGQAVAAATLLISGAVAWPASWTPATPGGASPVTPP